MQFAICGQNVREPLPKVSVTLSDCLACSGCVTSAESVLISQQGPEELLKVLERNKLSKVSLGQDLKIHIKALNELVTDSRSHYKESHPPCALFQWEFKQFYL